jgi:hypothetical protein
MHLLAYSAFLDLYLSIYPSVVLYKLKMPRKKKIYLSLALGLGCVYVSSPHHAICFTNYSRRGVYVSCLVWLTRMLAGHAPSPFTKQHGSLQD